MNDDAPTMQRKRASLTAISLNRAISQQAEQVFPFERNWIDYRSSVANVDRREGRGDTVETCEQCGAETDITPAPHSPRCPA